MTVTPRVGTSGGIPSTPTSAQRALMSAGQLAMGAISGRVLNAARDVAHRVGYSSHRVSSYSTSQRMRALVVPMPQSLDDDTEEDYDTTSGRNAGGREAAGFGGLPPPSQQHAMRVRSLHLDDEARGGGGSSGSGGADDDHVDAIAIPTMHVDHPHPTSLVHTVPPSRPELNSAAASAASSLASPRVTAWGQPSRPV